MAVKSTQPEDRLGAQGTRPKILQGHHVLLSILLQPNTFAL